MEINLLIIEYILKRLHSKNREPISKIIQNLKKEKTIGNETLKEFILNNLTIYGM